MTKLKQLSFLLTLALLLLILLGCNASDGNVTVDDATIAPTQLSQATTPTLIPTNTLLPATNTPIPPTDEPTSEPILQCTPPPCGDYEIYYCEGDCPGGCGTTCATITPLSPTNEPTRLPTNTPVSTPIPVATNTSLPPTAAPATAVPTTNTPIPPTNTPWPTATQQVWPTATTQVWPTNTPQPWPTNTPIPATPWPTPTQQWGSSGSSDAQVVIFRLSQTPTKPTQSVAIEWKVTGVNNVTITRTGGEFGEANATWTGQAASGQIWQNLPAQVSGWPIIYQISSPEDASLNGQFIFNAPCEWEWLFDFQYPGGNCPAAGVRSNGAQQNFERGFMIWIASQDIIIWSDWNGVRHGIVQDNYVDGVDPVNHPNIEAPAGFFEPEFGFGKVWREVAGVRDALGWGVDWASDYTVVRQSSPTSRYGFKEWIGMKNGGLITINHPDPIWNINSPR